MKHPSKSMTTLLKLQQYLQREQQNTTPDEEHEHADYYSFVRHSESHII